MSGDTAQLVNIQLSIGGTSEKLKSALSGVQSMLGSWGSSLGGSLSSIGSTVSGLVAGPIGLIGPAFLTAGAAASAALAGLIATLGYLAYASIDVISGQVDVAAQLGTTQAAFASLAHAADLAGVDQETLTGSLTKLQDKLASGDPKFEAVLERIGLSTAELINLRPDEQMAKIAEAMQSVENPAQRVGILMDLFGKTGAKLGPLMSEGAAGLKEAANEARLFGLTLDEANAGQVETLGDNISKFEKLGTGVGNMIISALAPGFNGLAESVFNAIKAMGGLPAISKAVGDVVVPVFAQAVDVVAFFASMVTALGSVIVENYAMMLEASARAIKGLEAFENWTNGKGWTEKKGGPGDMIQGWADGARGVSAQIQQITGQLADSPGTKTVDYFKQMSSQAQGATDSVNANTDAMISNAEAVGKANDKISDYIQKLIQEKDEIMLGADAAKIKELNVQGADQALISQAQYMQGLVAAAKEKKKADDEAKAAGKKLFEENMTDAEKYKKELEELDKLKKSGNISQETYDRAKKKLDAGMQPQKVQDMQFAGAFEQGSASARSIILRSQNLVGGGSAEKTAENTSKMVALLGQLNQTMSQSIKAEPVLSGA